MNDSQTQICLENTKDIIVFIKKYQKFFEASFSFDGEFEKWVSDKLANNPENAKFIEFLSNFSSELTRILDANNHLDSIRKSPTEITAGASLDARSCFIDAIIGEEVIWTEMVSNSLDSKDETKLVYEGTKSRTIALLYIMLEKCGELAEHLAYGLPVIEPLIQLWYQSQENKVLPQDKDTVEKMVMEEIQNDSDIASFEKSKAEENAKKRKHYETQKQLARPAAESLSNLFAQGNHSNTYQNLATAKSLQSEEALELGNENENEKEDECNEPPTKKQKLTGSFSGIGVKAQ